MEYTYRFFNEGDDVTLSTIVAEEPLTGKEIEMYIDDIEEETDCYVLWEEVMSPSKKSP